MRKTMLLTSAVILAMPAAAMAQCQTSLSCSALGYTATSCLNGGLKCPLGDGWWCRPEGNEDDGGDDVTLRTCTGAAKDCFIGEILNSDGTCSHDKVSDKFPLGVVIYIGGDKCGYAMTADEVAAGPDVLWGGYGTDISSLPNYTSRSSAITDFDACGNTQKIIQAGNAGTYPAAWAAYEYAPTAAPATKGKWCLPSAGMLNSLYTNLDIINNTISKLGGREVKNANSTFWSSSEYSSLYVWVFCTNNNYGLCYPRKDLASTNGIVRPVIEF